jgi:hypothetical protein
MLTALHVLHTSSHLQTNGPEKPPKLPATPSMPVTANETPVEQDAFQRRLLESTWISTQLYDIPSIAMQPTTRENGSFVIKSFVDF